MPPLRTERSGKACDGCRKQKTRCYPSGNASSTCLRCLTLKQRCSLTIGSSHTSPIDNGQLAGDHAAQLGVVNLRLDRLEATLGALIERLDSDNGVQRQATTEPSLRRQSSQPEDAPPVLMIRDVANAMGVQSPTDTFIRPGNDFEILTKASISPAAAHDMLSVFAQHYGRWVRFDETSPSEQLLQNMSRSPLLLCSIILIAVRHSNDDLARKAAPVLLSEAQQLLSRSLLTVADDMAFFQAVLILSLWSTTVGQVPMSMDGWLMTSYAIHHALAIPTFTRIFTRSPQQLTEEDLDAWCIWNHLSLAHLQYCVGMRRNSVLSRAQIDASTRIIEHVDEAQLSNFEQRMVAEVNLYWIIYEHTSAASSRQQTESALKAWKAEWQPLFDQPRSQFLQMGYHFAHLLISCQSIKVTSRRISNAALTMLVDLTTSILNLAMDTTDSRTQHLTDHIYHIITFSAITLCRLLSLYEDKLTSLDLPYNVTDLDSLVTRLVTWLKSIGLRSHVAHMLGSVVASQQRKLRPDARRVSIPAAEGFDGLDGGVQSVESLPFDTALLYPDFIQADLFDVSAEDLWPAWD